MDRVQKSQRNLPHWYREGATAIYWITFRLADSLPQEVLEKLHRTRDHFLQTHPKPWDETIWQLYNENFSQKVDEWLDAGHGSCVLERPELRQHFIDALMKFDGDRHDVLSAVVMPNHVHLLLHPREGTDLGLLLKGIKGTSARKIQQSLGVSGRSLWMEESYDHIVRSKAELAFLLDYIRRNPGNMPAHRYWLAEREIGLILRSDPLHEILYVEKK